MRKRILIAVALSAVLLTGCVGGKTGNTEFTDVVNDHRVLTGETTDALIKSVEDELTQRRSTNSLSPKDEEALSNLIQRLTTMDHQSDLIAKYVNSVNPDDKLIGDLIKAKWTQNSK